MASITIRRLDDDLKKRLRLRAARNGRSMEDEVRTILNGAADTKARIRAKRALVGPAPPREAPGSSRPREAEPSAPGGPRVLLVIGGGIAAYKSLDLIRRLKERGAAVRCVLTAAAQQFVTPLSAAALSGQRVFTDLFDPASEFDVGHIRLARDTDLIIVAPATADLMAKMAGGHADDLASAVLLATDRPVLLAPAREPAHVGSRGDKAQSRAARGRRHAHGGSGRRRDGGARRGRRRSDGGAACDRRRRRSLVVGSAA